VGIQEKRIQRLEIRNKQLSSSRQAIAAGKAVGGAVAALTAIMSDQNINIRRRLAAAGNILGYRAPQAVVEAAQLFLASIYSDTTQNVDHRLAAAETLRKCQEARVRPVPNVWLLLFSTMRQKRLRLAPRGGVRILSDRRY
jgi:hypothetical protein